jgi:hypothetical protein
MDYHKLIIHAHHNLDSERMCINFIKVYLQVPMDPILKWQVFKSSFWDPTSKLGHFGVLRLGRLITFKACKLKLHANQCFYLNFFQNLPTLLCKNFIMTQFASPNWMIKTLFSILLINVSNSYKNQRKRW